MNLQKKARFLFCTLLIALLVSVSVPTGEAFARMSETVTCDGYAEMPVSVSLSSLNTSGIHAGDSVPFVFSINNPSTRDISNGSLVFNLYYKGVGGEIDSLVYRTSVYKEVEVPSLGEKTLTKSMIIPALVPGGIYEVTAFLAFSSQEEVSMQNVKPLSFTVGENTKSSFAYFDLSQVSVEGEDADQPGPLTISLPIVGLMKVTETFPIRWKLYKNSNLSSANTIGGSINTITLAPKGTKGVSFTIADPVFDNYTLIGEIIRKDAVSMVYVPISVKDPRCGSLDVVSSSSRPLAWIVVFSLSFIGLIVALKLRRPKTISTNQ